MFLKVESVELRFAKFKFKVLGFRDVFTSIWPTHKVVMSPIAVGFKSQSEGIV